MTFCHKRELLLRNFTWSKINHFRLIGMSTNTIEKDPNTLKLGIDIGGTTVKAALVAHGDTIVRRAACPTDADDIAGCIRKLCELLGIDVPDFVGVCSPGVIDSSSGIIHFAGNLGWRDYPLKSMLENELNTTVRVEHDVRCGARAESLYGCGYPSFVYLALGTGLSIAPVVGRTALNLHPWCGEIGQLVLPENGGRRIEELAAAGGIMSRWGDSVENLVSSVESDSEAADIWNILIDSVARCISYSVGLLGPLPVVVGGGISGAGSALFTPLQELVAKYCGVIPAPPIEKAVLGADSQLLGAANLPAATP
ncbi:MAG: ROK family protein [Corynebacterium sp.]|nr:ROK family protein [Corynebacterium sp.]